MTEQRLWAGYVSRGLLALGLTVLTAGCGFGPRKLEEVRIPYSEAVTKTSQEQVLLNIVRLRYGEVPTSLVVTSIAAQFECNRTGQVVPFFASAATGDGLIQTNGAVLPGASMNLADRPTFTFTPHDTRKLFTPLTLQGEVYLSETSWPMSTVWRLFTNSINGVSNGKAGSGPTSKHVPVYAEFLQGMAALQALRVREDVQVSSQERVEKLGGPVPAALVTPKDLAEAAKNGHEFRPDEGGKTWTLVKKSTYPILSVNPQAVHSPEMEEFVRIFHLQPGLKEYEISRGGLANPFAAAIPEKGLTSLDLDTRSLWQALFFVANGVEVPEEHIAKGIVPVTPGADGRPFDWQEVLQGLFKMHCCKGHKPPPYAYLPVCYRGYWFYIDDRDFESKTTFALVKEVINLDLISKDSIGQAPVLTLPLGGH